MSEYWTFSPSSKVYLTRCLDAMKPPDPNNKWVQRFMKNTKNDTGLNETLDIINGNNKTKVIEVSDSDSESVPPEVTKKVDSESCEQLLEFLETEPIIKFDVMVQECLRSPGIINQLAQKLSVNSVEKISNHLLNMGDVDSNFLEIFFTEFIPAFLRRDNCRLSLDLLVNASRTHPVEFKKSLNIILKDTDVTHTILNEFSQTLNQDGKLKFIMQIIESNLTQEQFQHHLLTIVTVYKECKKNSYLQSCMEKTIIENSEFCSTDKNFGKLLLSFLQEQKTYGIFKQSKLIEKTIEVNKTPFKKPCLKVFKEIVEMFG